MTRPAVSDVLKAALANPRKLHELIFNPEAVADRLDLPAEQREALMARTPDDLLGLLVEGGVELECAPSTCAKTRLPGDDWRVPGHADSRPALAALVERARDDPNFFDRLQRDPAAALSGLRLTAAERETLTANVPEQLLGLLVGRPILRAGCDDTCGYTCASTCGGNYTMSCGTTCAYTCDYTAGRQFWAELGIDPVTLEPSR